MFGCPLTGDGSNAQASDDEDGIGDKPAGDDGNIVIDEDGDSSESGKLIYYAYHKA